MIHHLLCLQPRYSLLNAISSHHLNSQMPSYTCFFNFSGQCRQERDAVVKLKLSIFSICEKSNIDIFEISTPRMFSSKQSRTFSIASVVPISTPDNKVLLFPILWETHDQPSPGCFLQRVGEHQVKSLGMRLVLSSLNKVVFC